FDSNDFMKIDPTHGFVDYKNYQDAHDGGLIKTQGTELYIGVDSDHNGVAGRGSVRLESQTRYNKGLIIAHFTHIPKAVCGAWPAFWMYGPNWPNSGEADVYEQWNLADPLYAFHTGAPADVGACTLKPSTFSATQGSNNCYIHAQGQFDNEGSALSLLSSIEKVTNRPLTDATQWTSTVFRVWTWPANKAPADALSGEPNPASWGLPTFSVDSSSCDIDRAFKDMRLVLNIDFCGDAAGNEGLWGWTTNNLPGYCSGKTGYGWCPDYVNSHAGEYEEVYWKVKDIRVFQ
ncbi:putative endo-1,3(4)-beta-glucanase, partial [Podospora didyma]